MSRTALDVSPLPTFAFGQRSILWWATMGLIAIEGTAFALLIAAYLFLKWRVPDWPPGVAPPGLLWPTLTTLVLLISLVPNQLTKKAAESLDLVRTKFWISVCLVLGAVFSIFRALDFTTLNCWWDTNAYGSIVWTLLGVHTAHIVTDIIDTAVLAGILFTPRIDAGRFVDVSENAFYWYFVVVSWLPIYVVLYLAPRFL